MKKNLFLVISLLFLTSACQSEEMEVNETMANQNMEEKIKKIEQSSPKPSMPPLDDFQIKKPEYKTIQAMLKDMTRALQPDAEEQMMYSSPFMLEKHIASSTYIYSGYFLKFGNVESEEMKNELLKLQKYAKSVHMNQDQEKHKDLFKKFEEYLWKLNEKYNPEGE
ncbi:hypothetical protein [Bacillus sp. FJAT-47783]|uniref:hypothetical protein n=1 Tax=Bacillus sp. FJAT-47783 TaxID=2922712 RepID=UPI001FADD902|nr:hypothetical protein [Bacillus sp. FJAT-47783]